jgi:hypothetical protein
MSPKQLDLCTESAEEPILVQRDSRLLSSQKPAEKWQSAPAE